MCFSIKHCLRASQEICSVLMAFIVSHPLKTSLCINLSIKFGLVLLVFGYSKSELVNTIKSDFVCFCLVQFLDKKNIGYVKKIKYWMI